jgi:hypothetical protein
MSNKLDTFLSNKQQGTQPQNTATETTETQEINDSEQIVGLVESLYKGYEPMVKIAGQLLSIKIATAINTECQNTLLDLSNVGFNLNQDAITDARKRLAIADNNMYSKRLLLAGKNG